MPVGRGAIGPVLLWAFTATAPCSLFAQAGRVTLAGLVRDSMSMPIADAEVVLDPGLLSVATDSSGVFSIDSVPPGTWTVTVQKLGFGPLHLHVTILDDDRGVIELQGLVLPPAHARRIVLFGTVREPMNNQAVEGARIRVDESIVAHTDRKGRFTASTTVPEAAAIDVARIGYRPLRFELWPGNQDTVKLAVVLRPVAIQLAEIVIEGDRILIPPPREFEEHRKLGFGTFLTKERIERIGSSNALTLLSWAGVWVTGSGFDGYQLQMPGAPYSCRGAWPVIFIDGRLWNRETAINYLELTGPRELVGVEVFKGPAGLPVEYNVPDATCGVVAFWTRP